MERHYPIIIVLGLKIFDKYLDQAPWYGIEQEYFLIDSKNIQASLDAEESKMLVRVNTIVV